VTCGYSQGQGRSAAVVLSPGALRVDRPIPRGDTVDETVDGELEPEHAEPPTHLEAVMFDLRRLQSDAVRRGILATSAIHLAERLDRGFWEKESERVQTVRELRMLMTQVMSNAVTAPAASTLDELKKARANRDAREAGRG
jgi:hypothetical protein